jgi:hypothetical protein
MDCSVPPKREEIIPPASLHCNTVYQRCSSNSKIATNFMEYHRTMVVYSTIPGTDRENCRIHVCSFLSTAANALKYPEVPLFVIMSFSQQL